MLLEDRPLDAEGAVNMEVKLRLLKYPVPKVSEAKTTVAVWLLLI